MLTSQPENCGAPVGAVSSAGMSAKTPIAKSNGEANAAINRRRLEMPSARQATTSPQQTKSIASKRLFTGHALMEMPRKNIAQLCSKNAATSRKYPTRASRKNPRRQRNNE